MHDEPLPSLAARRAAADALAACRDAHARLAVAFGELRAANRGAQRRWAGLGAQRFAADAEAAERELAARLGALEALTRRVERGLAAAELAARRRDQEHAGVGGRP